MKKAYIKPENTVVAMNVKSNVLQASQPRYTDDTTDETGGNLAREVIQEEISAPDAWDEW